MKINPSAHFEFKDESSAVIFKWGVGKSKHQQILVYTSAFYPTAKQVLQEFLGEPDLREKIAKFAHFLNLGSELTRQDEIVFALEVMWRYDWEKVLIPSIGETDKRGNLNARS